MNWNEMLNHFQGQGSIFWIAAASIAAGATLLVVAGVLAARRGMVQGALLGFAWPRVSGPARGYRRANPAEPPSQVENTATGYRPTGMAALGVAPQADLPTAPELEELHNRLRAAARTLESLQARLQNPDEDGRFSGLKGARGDVEYVFRAGIG